MVSQALPSVEGIDAASSSIDPAFLHSPLLEQALANGALGHRLLAKVETLNPIRSFKRRGTDWWMTQIETSDTPIVSASAGNFGQGPAYCAAKRRRQAIIFASRKANPLKLAAMRRLGATVILEGGDFDAAKEASHAYALEHRYAFVEDGDSKAIAEGAGTIAKELTDTLERDATDLNCIVVPLGNGPLLTGMGTWIKAKRPGCRVIGVVASGATSMKNSWKAGSLLPTPSATTIADGIAVRVPVAYAVRSMVGTVDDVLEVDDEAIVSAMSFSRQHYGLVVEPAGAAGLAALLRNRSLFKGMTVATVFCGGNVAQSVA